MQELLERKKGLHRKMLIVDDEFIEREMLGHMLDDMYEVAYAENGAEAADIIRREKNTLSLVILDLHMPVLDGYSLLEIMRSDTDLRRIPAIVLTSEKDAEVRSLHLGAADFITKPYEVPDVVRARVRHAIELAEDTIIIHETQRDELTGLFNKQFFFEYGKRLDEQNGFMPMDALVIDINRFHLVNELYGRNYGDKLLQQIGNSLHELVSRTGGLACRSGSNSFCVYLPHSDSLRESLNAHIAKLDELTGDKKISIRLGVYSDDGSGLDILKEIRRKSSSMSSSSQSTTSAGTSLCLHLPRHLCAGRIMSSAWSALVNSSRCLRITVLSRSSTTMSGTRRLRRSSAGKIRSA